MNNKMKKINSDFFDIFTHMTKQELVIYDIDLAKDV